MAEHTSNAPHASMAENLWRELNEAYRQRDAALAERDRLRDDLHGAARDWYDLRTAARAFLAVLDRTTFSAVALRGPELDALREACGE